MMKRIKFKSKGIEMRILLFLFTLLSFHAFAAFPITDHKVKITKLEVWPSNTGASRYNAWVEGGIPNTGCASNVAFTIEAGPGADAAYSMLLAAMMAGKEVELHLTRCEYFVVADRVRIYP